MLMTPRVSTVFAGGRYLRAISKNRSLSGVGKSIMLLIASTLKLGGDFTDAVIISVKRLVEETSFGRSTILDQLRILINNGYVIRRQRTDDRNGARYKASEYALTSKVFDEYQATLAPQATTIIPSPPAGPGECAGRTGLSELPSPPSSLCIEKTEDKTLEQNSSRNVLPVVDSTPTTIGFGKLTGEESEALDIVKDCHGRDRPYNGLAVRAAASRSLASYGIEVVRECGRCVSEAGALGRVSLVNLERLAAQIARTWGGEAPTEPQGWSQRTGFEEVG